MAMEYQASFVLNFANSTNRNTVYSAIKAQIQTYVANNPGVVTSAEGFKLDRFVPDNVTVKETI